MESSPTNAPTGTPVLPQGVALAIVVLEDLRARARDKPTMWIWNQVSIAIAALQRTIVDGTGPATPDEARRHINPFTVEASPAEEALARVVELVGMSEDEARGTLEQMSWQPRMISPEHEKLARIRLAAVAQRE